MRAGTDEERTGRLREGHEDRENAASTPQPSETLAATTLDDAPRTDVLEHRGPHEVAVVSTGEDAGLCRWVCLRKRKTTWVAASGGLRKQQAENAQALRVKFTVWRGAMRSRQGRTVEYNRQLGQGFRPSPLEVKQSRRATEQTPNQSVQKGMGKP